MSNIHTQHQPSRAQRRGNHQGNRAKNNANNPSTQSATLVSTSDRKSTETNGDPQPAPRTPASSVLTYNTPGELLNAAIQMTEEDSRALLLRELPRHGWKAESLAMLQPDSRFCISWPKPQVAYWVERINCAVSHIGELSFGDCERLASLWCSAIDATNEYDDVKALKLVRECENAWSSPLHARRSRYWILGNLLPYMVIEPPISETLAVWFRDFSEQTEVERDILRRLWHDDHEQTAFDAMPEELQFHDSYTSLESLLEAKNLILGFKKVFGARDEDLALSVVRVPWTHAYDTCSTPSESTELSTSRPTTSVGRPASTPAISVRQHDVLGQESGVCYDLPADYASKCREWAAYAEANPDLPLDSRPEISDRKCFIDTLSKLADAVDQLHENQKLEHSRRAIREAAANKLAKLAKQVNEPLINVGWHRVCDELYYKGHVVGAQRTLDPSSTV